MSRSRVLLLAILAAIAAVGALSRPQAGASAGADSPVAPGGLDGLLTWTTSRVAGSPEPPSPLVVRPAHAGLKLDRPLHIEIGPGGHRWFVCQEAGQIVSFSARDAADSDANPFLDIRRRDAAGKPLGDRRIWSVAFHPRFADNGYVYVCWLDYNPQPNHNRIVRYTVPATLRGKDDVPAADPTTEFEIIRWPAGVDHFGGCLVFGGDGMLYFSAGDGHGYGDGDETGQRIDDLNASILRIDIDRPDAGKAYGIPADNPFVSTKDARPEVWAYGLRNVWKFSIDISPNAIDKARGDLWAGDVGQDLWEPVVLVARGGNYGWSVKEGTHDFRPHRKPGPTPILPPVYQHEHSEARSLTGGFVYRGREFPELVGHYIYGDYETGKVWALKWDGAKVASHRELVDTPLKLVCFGQDGDGELVLLDYQGSVHRLDRNPDAGRTDIAAAFPRKLSQTGLFASTKDHAMAAGVIPYDVNSPLWSDGAHKHRYLALPPGGKMNYSPTDAWGFPDGSVLVKTFEMETEAGNPASRRRLETRLLHIEQGHWRGYTYLWNADQTDADLLDDPRGKDEVLTIRDAAAPDGVRRQTWHYPSRAECTLCHTMPAGFVLGVNTRQMNRDLQYVTTRDNQIRALDKAGLFKNAPLQQHGFSPRSAEKPDIYTKLPTMPDPLKGDNNNLDRRARAYLDANCSHCHRKWGGGNALFELQFRLPLDQTRLVNVDPQHGDHGIAGAKLLVPGDPGKSLLLWRMKQLGPHRMPRVGSNVIDEQGVKLIERWIEGM